MFISLSTNVAATGCPFSELHHRDLIYYEIRGRLNYLSIVQLCPDSTNYVFLITERTEKNRAPSILVFVPSSPICFFYVICLYSSYDNIHISSIQLSRTIAVFVCVYGVLLVYVFWILQKDATTVGRKNTRFFVWQVSHALLGITVTRGILDRAPFIPELIEKRYGCSMKDPSFIFSQIYRQGDKIHPAVEKWFRSMDTRNEGRITSKELQQAFEIFQGKHFSDSTCKFVVRLFDLDRNGGLNINEFESLYYHIKLWVNAFNIFDRERSGYLDEYELDQALKQMDIHFTTDFVRFLIKRGNPNATKMSLDQYLITCIQIQKFTDEFKTRDTSYAGNINVKYEEFLELILRCL